MDDALSQRTVLLMVSRDKKILYSCALLFTHITAHNSIYLFSMHGRGAWKQEEKIRTERVYISYEPHEIIILYCDNHVQCHNEYVIISSDAYRSSLLYDINNCIILT